MSAAVFVVQVILETHTFAGNEANELAHAFLHAFLCFFRYLRILGKRCFHDTGNWSKVVNVSICIETLPRGFGAMVWLGW